MIEAIVMALISVALGAGNGDLHITTSGEWTASILDTDFDSNTYQGNGDETIRFQCEDFGIYSLLVQHVEEGGILKAELFVDGKGSIDEAVTEADYGIVTLAGQC